MPKHGASLLLSGVTRRSVSTTPLLFDVSLRPVSSMVGGAIDVTRQTILVVIDLGGMYGVYVNPRLRTSDRQIAFSPYRSSTGTSALVERRAPVVSVVLATVWLEWVANVRHSAMPIHGIVTVSRTIRCTNSTEVDIDRAVVLPGNPDIVTILVRNTDLFSNFSLVGTVLFSFRLDLFKPADSSIHPLVSTVPEFPAHFDFFVNRIKARRTR